MCKLEGITEQVDHHLTQSQRIKPIRALYVVGNVQVQIQALRHSLVAKLTDYAFHKRLQRNRLRCQLQATGFNPGQVQAVTDQGHELTRRSVGSLQSW
ncbi:hypothetical protein D3C75_1177050 [compost metagenome]